MSCLGGSAHAHVSMWAVHFHKAVADTTSALQQSFPAVQSLCGLPWLLYGATTGLATMCVALILVLSVKGQQHGDPAYVETITGVVMYLGLLASVPASVFIMTCAVTFDTILLCFLTDDSLFARLQRQSQSSSNEFEDACPYWVGSSDASHALHSSARTPALLRDVMKEVSHHAHVNLPFNVHRADNDDFSAYELVNAQSPVQSDVESD